MTRLQMIGTGSAFASDDVFGGAPEETKKAMDGVVSYAR
jgi:hypothetical protein